MTRGRDGTIAVVLSSTCAHDWSIATGIVLSGICRGLARRGRRLLLAIPKGPELAAEFAIGGVTVFRPLHASRHPLWRWPTAVAAGIQIAQALDRHDVRQAHLFGFYRDEDALTALLPLRWRQLPYVISRQTIPSQTLDEPPQANGKLLERLYTRARCLVAPSRKAGEECLAAFPALSRTRLAIIPNGVDLVRFGQPARRVSDGQSFILSTARQIAYKGLDILVFAYFDLVRSGATPDLVLCGADHSHGHLQGLVRRLGIAERVRFVGEGDADFVKQLLDRCLAFVLPSRIEAFGTAALEAMAAGAPVVVSRGAGAAELIQDGVNGLLVEPGNVEELRDALKRLIRDAPLRERMGLAARRSSLSYSWASVAEALDDLYARVDDDAANL